MKIKKIAVIPYNPDWPQMFDFEADLIKQTLGDHCFEVHHIGSTSIPGLAAKEDLDILCVVDRLSSALHLQSIGYVLKGELNIPLRVYFSKTTPFSKVNLHVVEKGHGFIDLNLCFRNYLRTHEEVRHAYQNLKYQLIQDPSSFERINGGFPRYTLEKDSFIKTILDQADFRGVTVNFCTHYREWEAYHRIRQEQIFQPINIIYDHEHPTITAENHYHFVLYKGSQIVSVAHVELLKEKDEAALRSLATDSPYQRQGYGAQMMIFLEKWLHFQERKIFKMHVRLSAEPFYRKLGYTDMFFDDPCINEEYLDLGKKM